VIQSSDIAFPSSRIWYIL